MIIPTSRKTPQLQELSKVLTEEFSDQYSYKLFGLGSEKSIVVRKSMLVGVQITPRENEIRVDGTIPSVAISFFSALIAFALSTLGIIRSASFIPLLPSRNLENEIADFLKRKYD